jgi:putative DNA modification/repair radical SAM protein
LSALPVPGTGMPAVWPTAPVTVDLQQKLGILADAAKYDASCASGGAQGDSSRPGICHSYTPDGRCVSLLKLLLTNYCSYDCVFCVNRVSSDIPRARFTPREVVDLTLSFYRRNYIDGLFLSSGIFQSPDQTMEQMVEIARSLRQDHGFKGYIHLKAIPGCSDRLIELAGTYADRLSANIELPTQKDLVQLAPDKKVAVIETTMSQIKDKRDEAADGKPSRPGRVFAPAGQSTQMVIGATPSSDREILTTASGLYGRHKLRRVYYSAFSPYPSADARLPLRPAPLVREHRLYQADWLMRFYGFGAAELTSETRPNLDLEQDPKLTWALAHREFFPVDINRAAREALLRVPGIGYRNADRILHIRRYHALAMEDLRKLHVRVKLASPFVTAADHTPGAQIDAVNPAVPTLAPSQLELFASLGAQSGDI